MHRLLYISESLIEHSEADRALKSLVAQAETKNAKLGLTGALIFTGDNFAQVLEGPKDILHIMMSSIYNDPRHKNVVIVSKSPVATRQFSNWQMAYQGPSTFVSRHVTRLLQITAGSDRARASEWLVDLALEFSKTHARPRN
jgi:hypothetical protein